MTTAQPAPVPAASTEPAVESSTSVGLRPRAVSMLGSVILALSGLAPLYTAMVGLGIIFAVVGAQTPGILWLGWIPVLGIAWSYRQLNRLRPSAGASYTWVERTLGAGLGYLQGWVILCGNVVLLAFATMQLGTFAIELLRGMGVTSVAGIAVAQETTVLRGLLGLLLFGALLWVSVIGIGATVRMQMVLTALEVAFLVGLTVAGLALGDGPPVSLDWLNPTHVPAGLFSSALVLGALTFWGWDVSSNVSEEAVDARQTGRAGVIAVVFILLLFVSYTFAAMRVAPVPDLANVEAYQSNLVGMLVQRLFGDGWATVVTGAIIISVSALVQVFLVQTSRTAYAMGRDGAFGSVWARVHPRYRTPWVATLLIGAIAAVLAIAGTMVGTVGELVTGVGTGLGVTIAYYYGVSGITCAVASWRLARQQSWQLLHLVVIPLLCGVALLVFGALALDAAWSAAGGGQLGALLPLALLVAGLPLAIRWQLRRRSRPVPPEETA